MSGSTDIQDQGRALREIIRKANVNKPKANDVAALQQALMEHADLWRIAGDMALTARNHTIDELQATPAIKESIRQGLRQMKRDLGYADAPLLERLLIEQVLLCWLRLNFAEYQYTSITVGEATWKKRDYWERRLSTSQQRYVRAIEALARIRKLARPTPLQVNIGGQQVIAAGDVHAG